MPTDPVERSEGANEDRKGAADGEPHIPPVVRAEIEIPPAEIDRQNARDKQAYALEKKKLRVEVATLVVVLVYATVAALQWYQMIQSNRLTERAVKATKVAADAAVTQAKASLVQAEAAKNQVEQLVTANRWTEQALKETKRSNVLAHRAWVNVIGMDRPPFDPNTTSLAVRYKLTNMGHTPAFDVTATCWWILTDQELPIELPRPKIIGEPISMATIAPGIPTSGDCMFTNTKFTTEQSRAIKDGRLTFYVYGIVTYKDPVGVSGNSGFCAHTSPKHDAMSHCPRHQWMK
jgi:hypothetical protein